MKPPRSLSTIHKKQLDGFKTDWFDPGLMDHLLLQIGTLLEYSRTYITKITVPSFSIVETLDVIKDILLGIISRSVVIAIHSFAFE